jgi:hypothetical protein
MKLIVDIPDGYKDKYKSVKNGSISAKILLNCIANGTVVSDTNAKCIEYYTVYDSEFMKYGHGGYETLEEAMDFADVGNVVTHTTEFQTIVAHVESIN